MLIEPLASADEAIPLLLECALPVADLSAAAPIQFFGIRAENTLIGLVGLEAHPPHALLRSLAVAPAFRASGLGRKLVAFAESQATARGITQLFLLTTTAEKFFAGLGYSPVDRADAPPEIQSTAQFSGLCPSSSAFLCKHVGTPAALPRRDAGQESNTPSEPPCIQCR
jgi:amino-acid N-acetyltransferase